MIVFILFAYVCVKLCLSCSTCFATNFTCYSTNRHNLIFHNSPIDDIIFLVGTDVIFIHLVEFSALFWKIVVSIDPIKGHLALLVSLPASKRTPSASVG